MWIASLLLLAVAWLGGGLFELSGRRIERQLPLVLAFGGAYLVGLLFLHLVPEAYANAPQTMGLFVLIGFLLQGLLEYVSQGVEHGHLHLEEGLQSGHAHSHGHGHDHSHAHSHAHDHGHAHDPSHAHSHAHSAGSTQRSGAGLTPKLGMPWAIFISLCLHAVIEAMPLGHAGHDHGGHDHSGHSHAMNDSGVHDHADHVHVGADFAWAQLDTQLLLGIAMHHIPVAVVIMGLMQALGVTRGRRWLALTAFGLMPALGMGLFEWILHSGNAAIQEHLPLVSQGILIGFLLHISTTMLFESGDGHRFNAAKLGVTLTGLLLAVLTL
ncbi:MAG: hypothetical protein RJA19_1645 [Bacteroidota bacterium]